MKPDELDQALESAQRLVGEAFCKNSLLNGIALMPLQLNILWCWLAQQSNKANTVAKSTRGYHKHCMDVVTFAAIYIMHVLPT